MTNFQSIVKARNLINATIDKDTPKEILDYLLSARSILEKLILKCVCFSDTDKES